jgi:excisionase family DNA binding protein
MADTRQLPKLTYSTREVAVMLGVSRPTVDRLVRDGVLPSVDLGCQRSVPRLRAVPFIEAHGGEDSALGVRSGVNL